MPVRVLKKRGRLVKIGFIQARNDIDVQWFQPLAFGYLKAYLEKYLPAGTEVQMDFLDDLESVDNLDVVGVSATSQDFGVAKTLAARIKNANRNAVVVLGGHHITYLPETLPEEVDIGVRGEGEQTFLELVRLFIDRKNSWTSDDLGKIQGIVYRADGALQITDRRSLIDPLDQIPIPFRAGKTGTYLFSSRGCPFQCSFCSSSAFWQKVRFFSAEYVLDEIESLLDPGGGPVQHISVWDDLFIADRSRLGKVADLLEKRGLNGRVSFSFSVRANLVNDALCELLTRMNVKDVGLGLESGSNRILELLNKGVTVDVNQKALDTLHRHKIPALGSFIVGCPTETEGEVRSTYEFILKNIHLGKLSPHCAVNILSPMPGTRIWQDAVATGLITPDRMDWDRLAAFASFRNSTLPDFDSWVRVRRQRGAIYLAEDTLPQERLYEIMASYENLIVNCQKARLDAERQQWVQSLSDRVATISPQVADLSGQVAVLTGQVAVLTGQVADVSQQVTSLAGLMGQVTGSRSWKVAMLLRRCRLLLAPPNSRRARVLRRLAAMVRL